jgi:hypothetical protein
MERDHEDDQSPLDIAGTTVKNAAEALQGDLDDDNPSDIRGIYGTNQGRQNRDPDLGEEDVDSAPGSA